MKYTKQPSVNANLDILSNSFDKVDFVTVGRVDFVGSLGKDRNFVDTDEMYSIVRDVFISARSKNTMCYVGGAVSINSKDFISAGVNTSTSSISIVNHGSINGQKIIHISRNDLAYCVNRTCVNATLAITYPPTDWPK